MAALRRRAPAAFSAGLAGLAAAASLANDRRHCRCDGGRRAKRVAFIGNSFIYFNDLPRLMQFLCKQHGAEMHVDSVLRGGGSWKVQLRKGNDMDKKFHSPNALRPDGTYDKGAATVQELLGEPEGWDFVVLCTYSMEAATLSRRPDGIKALEVLAPMIEKAQAQPVLFVAPAYWIDGKRGLDKIGGRLEDFVWRNTEGWRAYAAKLAGDLPAAQAPRLADMTQAFELVRGERPELYKALFHVDGFHPSAMGSFLQACVIFCTVYGEVPTLPEEVLDDPSIMFTRARRMLPRGHEPTFPAGEELVYLRGVAARSFCSTALLGATDAYAMHAGPAAGRGCPEFGEREPRCAAAAGAAEE